MLSKQAATTNLTPPYEVAYFSDDNKEWHLLELIALEDRILRPYCCSDGMQYKYKKELRNDF